MVLLPKNVQLEKLDWSGISFRPGWAVNGNTAGGTSVAVSTGVHFKALGDIVDTSVTRVIMWRYVCY